MSYAERTLKEYDAILRRALHQDGSINLAAVERCGHSQRVVLRAALGHQGMSKDDARALVPEPPGRRRRRDLPVPAELELVAYEREALKPEREPGFQALALMPLLMGLRAQELLQLRRREVERAVEVHQLVFDRKGRHEARLPCGHVRNELGWLLETSHRNREKAWKLVGQILSETGNAHTQYCALRRLVRRIGRDAGLGRNLRPHLLRHGFASRMARAGAPLPVVQRWLGHSSVITTMIYVHPEDADLEKWVLR